MGYSFQRPSTGHHADHKMWVIQDYGYRYYDANTGRWVSRDPIGESGGVNLYGFVGNDAISAIDILGEDIYIFYSKAVKRIIAGKEIIDGPTSFQKAGTFEDYAEDAVRWCPNADKQKIEKRPYASKEDLMNQIRMIVGQVDMIVIIDHGGLADGRSYQFAGRWRKDPNKFVSIPDNEMMEILKRVKDKAVLTGCNCAETEDTKTFLDNAAKQLGIKILANEKLTKYERENGEDGNDGVIHTIDTSGFTTFPREGVNNPVPQPNNPVPQPNNPVPQPRKIGR